MFLLDTTNRRLPGSSTSARATLRKERDVIVILHGRIFTNAVRSRID